MTRIFLIESTRQKDGRKKTLLVTIFIDSIQDSNRSNPCTRKTDSQSPETRGTLHLAKSESSVKKREGVKGAKRKEMRANEDGTISVVRKIATEVERGRKTERERKNTREPETVVQRTRCTRLIIPLSCMRLAFTLTSQSLHYPHHRRRRRRRRVVGREPANDGGDRLYARRRREWARRRAVVARSA